MKSTLGGDADKRMMAKITRCSDKHGRARTDMDGADGRAV